MDCMTIQSTLSHNKNWKYDVFVSFRGETRNNFTDHLFAALRRHGILAFRDDTKLQKGGPISEGLMQAIEGSQVFIVVFSMKYASSRWCLQELAKIAARNQVTGQHVLPIFYDVSPAEVRWQSGNYEEAFMKHEERYKDDAEMMEQVRTWRAALTQVASFSGWDVKDKSQSAEIEKIVKEVTRILTPKLSSCPSDDIVGMQSALEEVEKLLVFDSDDDVQIVGICGMGGIGKSTLATILYEKFSHQYDASCFVHDVSKAFGDHGSIGVQKQLLCQAFMEEESWICNLPLVNNLIQNRFRHRKVFIILDNVEKGIQLERKAFKSNHVAKGYESLTYCALTYADGLPVAIKVLGSFLFGKDVSEWSSALVMLKEKPKKGILDVLRISFDGLEDMEKEIFLDIACFFSDDDETYVKGMLHMRGFHPDIGIRTLIDKSLIIREDSKITMHDLLRDLGRNIVREKSPKQPRRWSRLWNAKDLSDALRANKEAENVEAIVLPTYAEIRLELPVEALSKMSRLNLLKLGKVVNFSGSLHFLSSDLGYLEWKGYPFTCLPSNFQPYKMVKIILRHSNIKELWEGIKDLHNLTHMDLCYSENLVKIPNLSKAPNLEGCVKLVHLDPSIGSLQKLNFMNLRNCKSLVEIPNLSQAPKLEELDLEGCVKLVHLDASIGSLRTLRYLNLENCKNLVSIPNSIFHLSSLEKLNLLGCSKLFKSQLLEKPRKSEQLNTGQSVQTHMTASICKTLIRPVQFLSSRRSANSVGLLVPSLSHFPALRDLDISFCNLVEIPEAIGQLRRLESLNIGGNNIVTLPHCIKELPKLRELNLQYCNHLKWLHSTLLPIGGGTYGGLYVFNCPKLSDMEGCRQTAMSWMIKMIKVNLQSSFPSFVSQVVIPGSKIPRWFNKQNTGDSVKLDLSPILDDSNWIGIACCATFVVRRASSQFVEKQEISRLISCGFSEFIVGMYCVVPIRFKKDFIITESDHILLTFFSREEFIDKYLGFVTNGVYLDGIKLAITSDYPQEIVQVKSCGYRWVFKEDLEQFDPTMMYTDNQKQRFLAIEDEQIASDKNKKTR